MCSYYCSSVISIRCLPSILVLNLVIMIFIVRWQRAYPLQGTGYTLLLRPSRTIPHLGLFLRRSNFGSPMEHSALSIIIHFIDRWAVLSALEVMIRGYFWSSDARYNEVATMIKGSCWQPHVDHYALHRERIHQSLQIKSSASICYTCATVHLLVYG